MNALVTRLRQAYVAATTMDAATVRMLEQTHVDVRRNARHWGM